jgi:hypothetical protein
MRDWKALVERRLEGLGLEPEETTEVIAEVAAHLEDTCEEMFRQGMSSARSSSRYPAIG